MWQKNKLVQAHVARAAATHAPATECVSGVEAPALRDLANHCLGILTSLDEQRERTVLVCFLIFGSANRKETLEALCKQACCHWGNDTKLCCHSLRDRGAQAAAAPPAWLLSTVLPYLLGSHIKHLKLRGGGGHSSLNVHEVRW